MAGYYSNTMSSTLTKFVPSAFSISAVMDCGHWSLKWCNFTCYFVLQVVFAHIMILGPFFFTARFSPVKPGAIHCPLYTDRPACCGSDVINLVRSARGALRRPVAQTACFPSVIGLECPHLLVYRKHANTMSCSLVTRHGYDEWSNLSCIMSLQK